MTLSAQVRSRRGSLELSVDLDVEDEIVAVLGPNGAGKTSLFRVLAGLDALDAGRITLDKVVLDDPTTGEFVRPEARSVGMVFQDYLLFPFLSARDNVAFGLRSRGTSRKQAREIADTWLERIGLSGLGDAKPAALSGGQAQRVALARAVVTNPKLILLDEPLAALDASVRGEIRRDLRTHLQGIGGARLIVTHDPVDAAVLADRVVILEHGSITQLGSMSEIALHPRTPYVAELVGLNYFRGDAHDGVVTLPTGAEIVIADRAVVGEVCVAIHPHAVTVLLAEQAGSARNHWRGTISAVDNLGDRVRVRIDSAVPLVAEITTAAMTELNLVPGTAVIATAKATEISTYEA
jgi:molybdate transport system ATP-binding protein